MGWGTVGNGVLQLLHDDASLLQERCGLAFDCRAIVTRNLNRSRDQRLRGQAKLSTDLSAILEDDAIKSVIHLVGGTDDAFDIAAACLRAGKHVVTANKALLAERGRELFPLARQHQVAIAFEAAVAGGIPVIASLRDGLVANHIHSLHAILNGTCNYVLTQMEENGLDLNEAVGQAQELGYAESDPALDLNGTDTAHKLAILTRIAFSTVVEFGSFSVEGIQNITADDIASAKRMDCRIKLLAVAARRESGLELRVAPTLVPLDHPLASVPGNYNGVLIDGHAAGPNLLVGQGAGALPTASAVLSDLVGIATGAYQETAGVFSFFEPSEHVPVLAERDELTASYARFTVA
ncbi:MAG: homoserine dehydrogenase, partial [Planctomycetota bacterium]